MSSQILLMKLVQFLRDLYAVSRALRPTTLEQLQVAVRQLDRFAGGQLECCRLTEELVNHWLVELEQRTCPSTVAKKRAELLTIWRAAADHGLASPPKSRHIRRPSVSRQLPDSWSMDQLRQLLETARRQDGYLRNGINSSGFWCGLILTAYDTALRRKDLLALRFDQMREDGQIEIVQHKTGRPILKRLRDTTSQTIDSIRLPDRAVIFDWPHDRSMFDKRWSRLVTQAGLPNGRRSGLQKIRRTSASQLERVSPGSATEHLGHLSPQLARRNYLDPRVCGRRPELPPDITEQ